MVSRIRDQSNVFSFCVKNLNRDNSIKIQTLQRDCKSNYPHQTGRKKIKKNYILRQPFCKNPMYRQIMLIGPNHIQPWKIRMAIYRSWSELVRRTNEKHSVSYIGCITVMPWALGSDMRKTEKMRLNWSMMAFWEFLSTSKRLRKNVLLNRGSEG